MKQETRNKYGSGRSSCFLTLVSCFSRRGFTLVEMLVGAAVFLVVALAAYNAYIALFKIIDLGQYRLLAVNLANEQFEIARNLPYSSVGVQGGVPNGVIPLIQELQRGGVSFSVTTTVRNIDLPFDGTLGGTPNDAAPADNKLVEVTVSCSGCHGLEPITLTGQVAPKNLETSTTNGALLIQVFDANGNPIQGADVHVVNVATTTTIVIDDVTDANGKLQLVDLPPGSNAYRVTVSKAGYSTDRTYAANTNPPPLKPDATVILQQVTQVSFSIDYLGQMNISSVTPTCGPVGGFDFSLKGAKLITASQPKYSASLATDGSGIFQIGSLEWDSYTATPIDASYALSGINPLNPVTLNPSASVNLQLVAIPSDPRMLLVTVKDAATHLPLSSTTVILSKTGWNSTQVTGKGYLNQTDWSGGGGQSSYSNTARYWTDDNNIDVTTLPGEIRLREAFGSFNPAGVLESSSMDTGSASNFFTLNWLPADQPPLAGPNSVRFQLASNATDPATTTWNYKGPDGTAATFYDVTNTSIHSSHNGDRYLRYRVYLSTADSTVSPNISDVSFTFTSSCTPSGQVIFTDLDLGTYTINASKSGYTTNILDVSMDSDWQEVEMLMTQ